MIRILQGDCRDVMKTLPDASVDSIVTDPPYEIGFMVKGWDSSGIANDVNVWREALRVLKPGGHLLAFSGSRTYHRMVCAIEDAGFEIRDQIMWIYGSGFPKSLDVSKAIDKAQGVAGTFGAPKSEAHAGWIDRGRMRGEDGHDGYQRPWMQDGEAVDKAARQYEGGSEESRRWAGWGTALKPAHEPIVMARKPLIGTVAANVLAHGTGALNIDGSRIHSDDAPGGTYTVKRFAPGADVNADGNWKQDVEFTGEMKPGRWPANVMHDGSAEVVALFPSEAGAAAPVHRRNADKFRSTYGTFAGNVDEAGSTFQGYKGSAARFFYCAKADGTDRHDGLERPGPQFKMGRLPNDGEKVEAARRGNHHPTVKPTELMRYLVRLVTPSGGTVLDPFMGSGSTLKAAEIEQFSAIGIELDMEYIAIARRRVGSDAPLFADVA